MRRVQTGLIDYQSVVSDFEFDELYEWQQRALQSWKKHHFRGVIEAVTGAGKTRVGIAAVAQALRLGMKATVLVPTSELQEQWVASLRKDLVGAAVGRLGGNSTTDFDEVDVIVAIVNSASSKPLIEHFRTGLVVADECHRYAAPYFAGALEENYVWRLGLTATYSRNDNRNEVLDEYFGSIVYRIWYSEAQRAGVISQFDVALVGLQLLPNEQVQYEELTEKITKDTISLRNYLEYSDVNQDQFMEVVVRFSQTEENSPTGAIARRYLRNVADRQKILSQTPVKDYALAVLAPAILASERAIVFGSSREQAQTSTETLQSVGISAGYLMSGMSKTDRLGTMNAFRRGDLQTLCAPRVLDEGVDVPAADLGIQTSGSKVQRQFIQRLGRVIRKRPNGDRGRFVYLYAFGTIEDPATQEDFLGDVLPFARNYMFFDIEKHLDALIAFLQPQPDVVGSQGQQKDLRHDKSQESETGQPQIRWNDIYQDDEPVERLIELSSPDDPVKDYLRKIGQHALLSHEEMVELAQEVETGLYVEYLLQTNKATSRRESRTYWKLVRHGQLAFEKMLTSNLRLVVSIAKRFVRAHEETAFAFLDAIQEGNFGLIRAIQQWDYKLGHHFSTYATHWIRQSIGRSTANQMRLIRLPVHVHDSLNAVRRIQRIFFQEGKEPSIEQIAEEMKEPVEKVQQLVDSVSTIVSLSSERYVDNKLVQLSELIVDGVSVHDSDRVIEKIYRQEIRTALGKATSSWKPREKDILFRRWGINTAHNKTATLDEIGRKHGITRERIRQIVIQLLELLGSDEELKRAVCIAE